MLTDAEIDALALPTGWKPGPRPSDGLPLSSGLIAIYGAERAAEIHAETHERMATRMSEAAGRRFGWTPEQVAAAAAVYHRIPVHGIRGKSKVGSDCLAVLEEAARRAVPGQTRLALGSTDRQLSMVR